MAWASKKQYAILMNSEEGKDLIQDLPNLSQDEFQVEFGKILGKNGGTYNRDEDEDYKEDNEDDLPWWDKPDEDEAREAYGDDFEPTRENILNKQKETENAFDMPESEGWKPSNQGEKSFIKNEGKDNEMFIQYNGQDYDGSNQEYVAGFMKNGDYITEKFDNLEDAKNFLNNSDIEDIGYDEELDKIDENSKNSSLKEQREKAKEESGAFEYNITDEEIEEKAEELRDNFRWFLKDYDGDRESAIDATVDYVFDLDQGTGFGINEDTYERLYKFFRTRKRKK